MSRCEFLRSMDRGALNQKEVMISTRQTRRGFIRILGLSTIIFSLLGCSVTRKQNEIKTSLKFIYNKPPLIMGETKLKDTWSVIDLDNLPNPQPKLSLQLKNATPLTERLWNIALADIEYNIVKMPNAREYFGAGAEFGAKVYTRDISYSGILGINRLYPDIMRQSLEYTRKVRREVGFKTSKGHAVREIKVPWQEEKISTRDFFQKYNTNEYTRRTDDVVWLWCAYDLVKDSKKKEDWKWIYDEGNYFFEHFYMPFYDEEDGLFLGQAAFIDIHFPGHKTTGYPQDWTTSDCVLCKPTSTNALYVKGMQVMSEACRKLGKQQESKKWNSKAEALKKAIRKELRRPDGTFAYYKDRHGKFSERREVLGTAFVVLHKVVTGAEAEAALKDYPVTDTGIPLICPFFPTKRAYHNNTSWPFSDTFFIKAMEKADGKDRTAMNAALLARTCGKVFKKNKYTPLEAEDVGTFHELVHFQDKKVIGSGHQLWTAAAFVDVCRRAGLVEF